MTKDMDEACGLLNDRVHKSGRVIDSKPLRRIVKYDGGLCVRPRAVYTIRVRYRCHQCEKKLRRQRTFEVEGRKIPVADRTPFAREQISVNESIVNMANSWAKFLRSGEQTGPWVWLVREGLCPDCERESDKEVWSMDQ